MNEAFPPQESRQHLPAAGHTPGEPVTAIIAKAKKKGIVIKEADQRKLDFMCGGANHQGIAVGFAVKRYSELEDVLKLAEERQEKPFLIICDEALRPP